MEALLAPAVAMKEVVKWLDYKQIDESEREEVQGNIDALAGAFANGHLTMNGETFVITQKLKFPIGKDGGIKTLDFDPRLDVETLHLNLEGIKASNGDGRLLAHVCALTSKPKGILKKLDSVDYALSKGIASFFL